MRDLASSAISPSLLLQAIHETWFSLTTCLCGQTVWGNQVKKSILRAEWLLYFKSMVSRIPQQLSHTGKPFPRYLAARCVPGQEPLGGFESVVGRWSFGKSQV